MHSKNLNDWKELDVKILAIDPGRNTGWAEIEFGGRLVDKGIILLDDFGDFLYKYPTEGLSAIVVEGFRLYAHKAQAQQGSTVEAAQVIGMVKGFCSGRSVRFVQQQPDARKMGAGYVQYKLGTGHTPDDISAWLHGIYYLKKIGQLTTVLEKRLNAD